MRLTSRSKTDEVGAVGKGARAFFLLNRGAVLFIDREPGGIFVEADTTHRDGWFTGNFS